MPPTNPTQSARMLYENEIARHVLALRECLVRHDENWKAHLLMSDAVPYFLRDNPDIVSARVDQRNMVLHLIDEDEYKRYYGDNRYERPFEEQYGISPTEADRIPRVSWLRQRLEGHGEYGMHLDLGANDGWMLFHLQQAGVIAGGSGIDLSYQAVTRANHERDVHVYLGRIEDWDQHGLFNSVSCFEVLEHVRDPDAVLRTAHDALVEGGRCYLSTPYGACEMGDIERWDYVEPKGHVRAWLPQDFADAVTDIGFTVVDLSLDQHGLMLLEAQK